jgi:hypothetical protein
MMGGGWMNPTSLIIIGCIILIAIITIVVIVYSIRRRGEGSASPAQRRSQYGRGRGTDEDEMNRHCREQDGEEYGINGEYEQGPECAGASGEVHDGGSPVDEEEKRKRDMMQMKIIRSPDQAPATAYEAALRGPAVPPPTQREAPRGKGPSRGERKPVEAGERMVSVYHAKPRPDFNPPVASQSYDTRARTRATAEAANELMGTVGR